MWLCVQTKPAICLVHANLDCQVFSRQMDVTIEAEMARRWADLDAAALAPLVSSMWSSGDNDDIVSFLDDYGVPPSEVSDFMSWLADAPPAAEDPVSPPPITTPNAASPAEQPSPSFSSRNLPRKAASGVKMSLLDFNGEDAVDAPVVVDDRPICRHFLAGTCSRSDCMFSHDTRGTPCKFFLEGACRNGDACPFPHVAADDLDAATFAAFYADDDDGEDFEEDSADIVTFDASDFPPVHAGDDARPLSTERSSPARLSFAALLQLDALQAALPGASARDIVDALAQHNSHVASAVDQMAASLGLDAAAALASVQSSVPSSRGSRRPLSSLPARQQRSLPPPPEWALLWVSTGDSLAVEYARVRGEALALQGRRNELLKLATAAFMRGNGARARELSREAGALQQQIVRTQAEAAQSIFEKRNRRFASGHAADDSKLVVDLHGLHVGEALDVLAEILDSLPRDARTMYIITGTGHHSGRTRLPEAVQAFLEERGLFFRDCSTDRKGGMLAVDVSPYQS